MLNPGFHITTMVFMLAALSGCVYFQDPPHATDTYEESLTREENVDLVYKTNWLKKHGLTQAELPGKTTAEIIQKCGKPSRLLSFRDNSCRSCGKGLPCWYYCKAGYEEWFYSIPSYFYLLGSTSITVLIQDGVVTEVK